MAEVAIRQAISSDILELIKFDHSCETTHVWQLSTVFSDSQMDIQLREIKLPRSLRLAYPRRPDLLMDTWTKHTLFLVAAVEGKLAGYLILDRRDDLKSATASDLVVDTPFRRQGIASALLISAQEWLKRQDVTRFILEVPAKNHPGVALAQKLKFENNGFIDHYYSNQDILLSFVNFLK